MIKQAVILCGGKGSRLGKLTTHIPKPLLKVNSKPFIEYQIENLARHGIKEIYLICCYKYYLFKKKYHKKKFSILRSFVLTKKFHLELVED